MNVIIDGEKYIKADEAIGNNLTAKKLRKALVAIYWGDDLSDAKVEEYAKDLEVRVTEDVDEDSALLNDFVTELMKKL